MASYNKLASVVVNENITSWRFRVRMIRIHSFKILSLGPNEPPSTIWSYVLAYEAVNGSKIKMHIYPADAPRFKGLEEGEGEWVKIFRVQVVRAFTPFKPANYRCRLVVFEGTSIKPIKPLNNHHYMDFKCCNDIKYITDTYSLVDVMGAVTKIEPLIVCSDDRSRKKLVFYIRDNIEFQLKWYWYDVFFHNIEFQIKCVATRDHAYAFQEEFAKMRGRGVVIVVLKMWRNGRYIPGFQEPWIETYKGFSDFRFNPCMEEVVSFMKND